MEKVRTVLYGVGTVESSVAMIVNSIPRVINAQPCLPIPSAVLKDMREYIR